MLRRGSISTSLLLLILLAVAGFIKCQEREVDTKEAKRKFKRTVTKLFFEGVAKANKDSKLRTDGEELEQILEKSVEQTLPVLEEAGLEFNKETFLEILRKPLRDRKEALISVSNSESGVSDDLIEFFMQQFGGALDEALDEPLKDGEWKELPTEELKNVDADEIGVRRPKDGE